jgi:sulfur carrier protein ThiS
MLTINAKFVASELVPGLVNGEYKIEDGSTVLDLLAACENQCGAVIPEKNYKLMYPLFNGKPVALDKPLSGDGTLHLCRVVMGG